MVEAYRGVFGQLSLLLDIAWLPLLLLLAAAILPGYLHLYRGLAACRSGAAIGSASSLENVIEALIGLLCLTAFAVRWYQVTLFTGARAAPTGHLPRRLAALSALHAAALSHRRAADRRDAARPIAMACPITSGFSTGAAIDGGVARAGALHAALPRGRVRQAAIDRRGMARPRRQYLATVRDRAARQHSGGVRHRHDRQRFLRRFPYRSVRRSRCRRSASSCCAPCSAPAAMFWLSRSAPR